MKAKLFLAAVLVLGLLLACNFILMGHFSPSQLGMIGWGFLLGGALLTIANFFSFKSSYVYFLALMLVLMALTCFLAADWLEASPRWKLALAGGFW